MGLFGPDTRTINGIIYQKEADLQNQFDAEAWARAYQAKGYQVKVIPDANKKSFGIWVSVGNDPRREQEQQKQEQNKVI